MSGEVVGRLKRRARSFLRAAGLIDDPDLRAFFAERAMRLYLKAVLLELFGEEARAHSVRELLGLLARRLREAGYTGEAALVMEFAAAEKLALLEADEAYITARYGLGYTEGDAERLLGLLEGVARRVKLG